MLKIFPLLFRKLELPLGGFRSRVSFPFLWSDVQDMLSKANTAGCDMLMLVLEYLVSNYIKPDVKGSGNKDI